MTESSLTRKRRSRPVSFLLRLIKEKPLGTVGGVIALLLLFTGIFAFIFYYIEYLIIKFQIGFIDGFTGNSIQFRKD